MKSGLYAGRVVHARLRPTRHRLSYRVFSLLLDLDELDTLSRRLKIFGHNRAAIFSFHDKDHGDGGPDLRGWIAAQLGAAGAALAAPRIEILCYPRILGYVFNPLTVYFCRDGDELRWVDLSDGSNDILIATRNGQAARFTEREVRSMGRDTMGVTGIRLKGDDEVVGMQVIRDLGQQLLVVTELGFGKRTDVTDFPIKHRATGGVIANSLNADTGKVAAVRLVGREDEEVMLITEEGTMLRTEVAGVNSYRRASRGVTVMRPADGDRIISIAVFVDEGQPEEPETEE